MTYLLDVNVLVALFDAVHLNHAAAHAWFATIGQASWATCPITENGFVRVVSNPAYPTVNTTPGEAAERLRIFCRQPGHEFWPDAASLTDATYFDLFQLQGHRQITDLYLAGLAHCYRGSLATFDTSIPIAALVGMRANIVEIISID